MVNGSPFSNAQLKRLRKLVNTEITRREQASAYIKSLPESKMTPQVVIDGRVREIANHQKQLGELRELKETIYKELEPKCVDCKSEPRNPGLDVCGDCYHRRIHG